MDSMRWPVELRQRLGESGSTALAEVLDARDGTVLSVTTERFERRLSEECNKLRGEMQELGRGLRTDMKVLRSELVAEVANTRAELIKWAFVFWAGQLATMIGLATVIR